MMDVDLGPLDLQSPMVAQNDVVQIADLARRTLRATSVHLRSEPNRTAVDRDIVEAVPSSTATALASSSCETSEGIDQSRLDATITSTAGEPIGTLSAVDDAARAWTDEDRQVLHLFASCVADRVSRRTAPVERAPDVFERLPVLLFECRDAWTPSLHVVSSGADQTSLSIVRQMFEQGGSDALDLVHSGDRAALSAALARSRRDKAGDDLVFRAVDGDDGGRWLRVQFAVRHEADGTPVYSGVSSEVSSIIAGRYGVDKQAVFDFNHELRTPLQAIIGVTEFLKRETRPDMIAAHAQTIQSAADALLAIVNQTLGSAGSNGDAVTGPVDAPREHDGLPPTSDTAPEVDNTADGAHILLADDLDLNRKLICDMLSLEGYVVDSVADGAAAVKAAGEHSYDLILMDMIMPGMDGMAATRAIRALPAPACEVPIVALTAHSFREQLDSCLQAGMDATLTKPMSLDALTSAVATWTRKRRKAA